jgi:poly-gamma-glutamate capsule biosynthesis protein CapA/YwtB (metallophosphatase superfamily)
MWSPYGDFFDFQYVCIEIISKDKFVLYSGGCLRVDKLGKKCLVSATRFRELQNGIYLLKGEAGGKYVFQLVKPLRKNA